MLSSLFFFFNDTATTEIYTLSLHDALPISGDQVHRGPLPRSTGHAAGTGRVRLHRVSGEQGGVSAELRGQGVARLRPGWRARSGGRRESDDPAVGRVPRPLRGSPEEPVHTLRRTRAHP